MVSINSDDLVSWSALQLLRLGAYVHARRRIAMPFACMAMQSALPSFAPSHERIGSSSIGIVDPFHQSPAPISDLFLVDHVE
jgi:hypothetical protein